MDCMICRLDAIEDGDLMLCKARGVAFQKDMRAKVAYDKAYFNKCLGYEDQEIALKINAGRIALVDKYAGGESTVLDIGVGSGEFIKKRGHAFGYDVNPKAVAWLKEHKLWSDDLRQFRAFTFWDVIEHVEDINRYFKRIPDGSYLFTSLPIFTDLIKIRESKHYRPGEHLYYWTERGFIDWMALYRFELLEVSSFESDAGRDSIRSFAFRKSRPGYNETVAQYVEMHAPFYGASAWLYLDDIAPLVFALNPKSILDYGCGRSDLVARFWNDGKRKVARYDAAIAQYQTMPDGRFDLVICCDVMEHILMQDVDRVLDEIKAKSGRAIFTISLRPARAHLPDGRNAHVTLLSAAEWTRWIASVFGNAVRVPTKWDHILMLRTF